jgi:hypothetical protein
MSDDRHAAPRRPATSPPVPPPPGYPSWRAWTAAGCPALPDQVGPDVALRRRRCCGDPRPKFRLDPLGLWPAEARRRRRRSPR